MNYLLKIGCIFLFPIQIYAQNFEWNDNCKVAFNQIKQLSFATATQNIQLERTKNPQNLVPIYLENYIDFLKIYTSDDKVWFDKLVKNKDKRLSDLEKGNKNSPYFLFYQGEINLQWAALNVRFGNYLKAVLELKKAFARLKENQKKYPQFLPNQKSLALLNVLLGSVPDNFKWGTHLLGLNGDLSAGIATLNSLIDYCKTNEFEYKEEVITIYSMILLHVLNKPEEANQLLLSFHYPLPNPMSLYTTLYIKVYSKHTEEALKLVENSTNFNKDFPAIEYLKGLTYLHALEIENAAKSFAEFAQINRSKNLVKSTLQKLGWLLAMQNDTSGYKSMQQTILTVGATHFDADKSAQKEALANHFPNIFLLKARVYCDGGNYAKAYDLLKEKTEKNFPSLEEKVEYFYRVGKILDDWGKKKEAIPFYLKAIQNGSTLNRYFAANSNLNLGKIYEEKKENKIAIQYYEACLAAPSHEYKNSLDQKAKSGLNRIKKN